MSFVVKPYDSVELGQARLFELCTWTTWNTKPPHDRVSAEYDRVIRTIAKGTIGFVVGPMNVDGFFKMLLECGSVVEVPIDELIRLSRLM